MLIGNNIATDKTFSNDFPFFGFPGVVPPLLCVATIILKSECGLVLFLGLETRTAFFKNKYVRLCLELTDKVLMDKWMPLISHLVIQAF